MNTTQFKNHKTQLARRLCVKRWFDHHSVRGLRSVQWILIVLTSTGCISSEGEWGILSMNNTPFQVQAVAGRMVRVGNQVSCLVIQGELKCSGEYTRYLMGTDWTDLASLDQPCDSSNSSGCIYQSYPSDQSLLGKRVIEMEIGNNLSCAIYFKDDAQTSKGVACWGRTPDPVGAFGPNGAVGTPAIQMLPVEVPLPTDDEPIDLAVGESHACVSTVNTSKTDYQVFCWGSNSHGQLGYLPTAGDNYRERPVRVSTTNASMTLGQIYQIEAGDHHSCLLGRMYSPYGGYVMSCWGSNEFGQLGRADGETSSACVSRCDPTPKPVVASANPVAVFIDVVEIAAGKDSTCLIFSSNLHPVCFGEGSYGKVGLLNGDLISATNTSACNFPTAQRATCQPRPITLPGGAVIQKAYAISLGTTHGCVTRVDEDTNLHTLTCWGRNDFRQLGTQDPLSACFLDNASTSHCSHEGIDTYVAASTSELIWKLDVGTDAQCVLISGAPYCMGREQEGQLSTGDGYRDGITGSFFRTTLTPFNY